MVCEVRHADQITYHSYYSGFIPGLDARPDARRGSAAQRPSSPGASRRSYPVLYPASHEAAAREDYRWNGCATQKLGPGSCGDFFKPVFMMKTTQNVL